MQRQPTATGEHIADAPGHKSRFFVQCQDVKHSHSQPTRSSDASPRPGLRQDESDAEHQKSRSTNVTNVGPERVYRGLVVDPEHRWVFDEFRRRVQRAGSQLRKSPRGARNDAKRIRAANSIANMACALGVCPSLRSFGRTGALTFRKRSPRTPAMRTMKESPVALMCWQRPREQRRWSEAIAAHLFTRRRYSAFHVLVECFNLAVDGDLLNVAEPTEALQKTIKTVARRCAGMDMSGLIQADIAPSYYKGKPSLYIHAHQLLLAPPSLSAEEVSRFVRFYWHDMWDHPEYDNPFGGIGRVTKIVPVETMTQLRNENRYCSGLRGTDRRPLPKFLFGPDKPLKYGSAQFDGLLAFLTYGGLQITRFGEHRRGNNRRYKAVLAEMQLPESLASASAVGKSMHGTPEPAEEPPKPRVRTYVRRQPPAGEPTPARTVRQTPPARGVRAKSRR
jgi:hypothetical protein